MYNLVKLGHSVGRFVSITHKLLRFGVFEVNLDTEELRKSGTIMKLPPQPFRLLAMLANHAGQVVTREEIKEQLWGEDIFVDFEQGMNQCIKQIRTVLGDNAGNPLYVETLPRRGYRFLAPVISKNVWAPAPKIIKSTSGVQSDILSALTPDGTRVGPIAHEGPPRVEVVGRGGDLVSASVVPVGSTQVVAHEESPALRQKVTSAAAAAEALAPEIARLRNSPKRTRQVLLWIAVVLAVLVASILYWHRS